VDAAIRKIRRIMAEKVYSQLIEILNKYNNKHCLCASRYESCDKCQPDSFTKELLQNLYNLVLEINPKAEIPYVYREKVKAEAETMMLPESKWRELDRALVDMEHAITNQKVDFDKFPELKDIVNEETVIKATDEIIWFNCNALSALAKLPRYENFRLQFAPKEIWELGLMKV
jgi:hypothetical protein